MKQLLPILFLALNLLTFNNVRAQFVVNVTTFDCSGPNTCDGAALIDSNNMVNFTSVMWYMGTSLIQNGGTTIANLCPGNYTVSATGVGVTLTSPFTIGTATTNPCNGFGATLSTTPTSSQNACDGSITASVYGGTTPYSYVWNIFGGSNNPNLGNLCAGTYFVTINDANGCSVSQVGNIFYDTTNIDSINVIGNLVTGGLITGTLMSNWIYNCDIEMSALDTAYMVSATFGNSLLNQDSLYTVWYLTDTTGAFTYINYVYYAPFATGTYNLVLQVYCPIKSTPIYYNIISQFDVQSAGIASTAPVTLALSPNPVQDILSIQGINSGNYQIFNATGQSIQKGHFDNQIEVSQLTNGTYFLHIGTEILPFIKLHQ